MIKDEPQGKTEKPNDTSAKDKVEQSSQTVKKKSIHTGMSAIFLAITTQEVVVALVTRCKAMWNATGNFSC